MSLRDTYNAGVGAMMFDKQIARGEAMVDKASEAVKGVRSALIANAVVTGVSTTVLVASVVRARKRLGRG